MVAGRIAGVCDHCLCLVVAPVVSAGGLSEWGGAERQGRGTNRLETSELACCSTKTRSIRQDGNKAKRPVLELSRHAKQRGCIVSAAFDVYCKQQSAFTVIYVHSANIQRTRKTDSLCRAVCLDVPRFATLCCLSLPCCAIPCRAVPFRFVPCRRVLV